MAYRLVTRSDFDGLVCAMLLKQLALIDEITFVHPKDVQDGSVEITARDITTNLPYRADAHLVFDHHASEMIRAGGDHANHVIDPDAPSAARVVFDHYGGAAAFPGISAELLAAVDQADSAAYSLDEVLHPEGWVLLNFLMDPRTGLGRFRDFRISNYDLMMELIDECRDHDVDEVLALPDVDERTRAFRDQEPKFVAQLERCTKIVGSVAIIDLRDEDVIHAGNRFMVYALHPEVTESIHVLWGKQRQNTVLAAGRSIFNTTNSVEIGALMLGYGGGGHANAGTCQVAHDDAEKVLVEVTAALNGTALASVV
jgi:nanoRNase/pAp phosphatase (c-di-AMP/oligoRNAs hydrolase)